MDICLAEPWRRTSVPAFGGGREHDQVAVGIGEVGDPLAPRLVGRLEQDRVPGAGGGRRGGVDVIDIQAQLDPVTGRRALWLPV